jgi:hypothetical protein
LPLEGFLPKGEECSVFFNSEVVVKQGENMFPFLFSLFLNDLETFFLENNISDLEQISNVIILNSNKENSLTTMIIKSINITYLFCKPIIQNES